MVWYWVMALGLVGASALLHLAGLIRFVPGAHWTVWLVVALVLLNGGWMAFDGGRALIVGDYVTPQSGKLAGTLGPWGKVVSTVGIHPRSTFMKWTFVVYGLSYLALTAALVLGESRAWWGLVVVALLGLWYVPFGTLINVLVIVLASLPAFRTSIS